MSGSFINYKFTYNSTTTNPITTNTSYIKRTPSEKTVIKETPTGAKYKQVFGSGKISWVFTFPYSMSEVREFFQNAYEAQNSGYDLTLSEENNSGVYTDYEVIINIPGYTSDVIGSDPIDKGLTVEVFES